jgi:serine/threonine protein kinase
LLAAAAPCFDIVVTAGEVFEGRWVLDEVLGEGGMGKVLKARYQSSGYPCAIKLLLPEHKDSGDIVARFLNEAKIANKVGHPGVCRVIDLGWREDGTPYLVMEFLEGSSVESILAKKHGFLTIGDALRITKQVLEVLVAAHEQGIVHRDIKPDNIFVTRDGSIKVLDFGIARMPGMDITTAGVPMGTLGYMPPEIARGHVLDAGPRSDVWSVGATLFQLLTGELPHDFSGCQSSIEMLRHSAKTPARSLATLLPRCPTRLADVVDRMLAFDPQHRYTAENGLLGLNAVPIHPDCVGQTAHWVWNPALAATSALLPDEHEQEQAEPIVELEIERQYRSSGSFGRAPTGRPQLYVVGAAPDAASRTNAERRYDPAHDIEELHDRLSNDPSSFDDYHRLVESYLLTEQRDSAIAVARTLRFLKQATPEELALAEELDGSFRPPRAVISRKQWPDTLLVSNVAAQLSALFARLWPVLAAEANSSLMSLGLADTPLRAVSMGERGVPLWVAFLAMVMDMPPPELYFRAEAGSGFEVAVRRHGSAVQPLLIAGKLALSAQPTAARAFRIGRALARCHPYVVAARLGSASELRGLLWGAVALVRAEVHIPTNRVSEASRWRDAIVSWMPRDRIWSLRKPVSRVLELGQIDTSMWLDDCEKVAARVGLLLSDDLGTAARIIARENDEIGKSNDLIRDLTIFSVSMSYLELRRSLKIG